MVMGWDAFNNRNLAIVLYHDLLESLIGNREEMNYLERFLNLWLFVIVMMDFGIGKKSLNFFSDFFTVKNFQLNCTKKLTWN